MNIKEIKLNPDNPRVIKDDKFAKLKKSIQDSPWMLELKPIVIDENNIVLGGNMRLRALQDLGIKEVPVVYAKDLTEEQKKEYTIKDNLSYGEWGWDTLANEWDYVKLEEWGLDFNKIGFVPAFAPTFDSNELTDEDIIKRAKELKEFGTPLDVTEVVCPKCLNEFNIRIDYKK